MCRGRDAHEGVIGAYTRRERFATGIGLKAVPQESSAALVDIVKTSDGCGRFGEGLGRGSWRRQDLQCGVHMSVRFPELNRTAVDADGRLRVTPAARRVCVRRAVPLRAAAR